MFSEADFLYSMLVIPLVFVDVEYPLLCCSNGFIGSAVIGRTIRSNSSTAISHAPVEIDFNKVMNKLSK